MKKFPYIFCLISLLLFFSTPSWSQKKDELTPLADNANLADIKKWLTDALLNHTLYKSTGNSFYSTDRELTESSFEGCVFSFILKSKGTSYPSAPGSSTSGGLYGGISATGGGSTSSSTYSKVSFDLKDINANSISLSERAGSDKILGLWMSTLKDKKSISEGTVDSKKNALLHTHMNTTVYIPLKKASAEYIKTGFVRAVKFCQAEKWLPSGDVNRN